MSDMNGTQKVWLIVGACAIVFVSVAGWMIFSGLDKSTLAILSGTIIGGLVGAPPAFVGGLLLGRRNQKPSEVHYVAQPRATARPRPVVHALPMGQVLMPQQPVYAQPAYGQQAYAQQAPWYPQQPQGYPQPQPPQPGSDWSADGFEMVGD